MLTLEPQEAGCQITYDAPIVFIGSCFSDNIGALLARAKFPVVYNRAGVVFDAISISKQLQRAIKQENATEAELIYIDELWHSWLYHSKVSSPDKTNLLQNINSATSQMHHSLQQASHLFITLGTAYSYVLVNEKLHVANCHKAPKAWFDKQLLSVTEMVAHLKDAIQLIKAFNPKIDIVITVSPVKHLRDGIINNNRSKARLIETAHLLAEELPYCTYFPAYELVTDVLRDYRFYAKDMAHPNEQAIEEVFDFFSQTFFGDATKKQMQEILQLVNALQHIPLHFGSPAHQAFLKQQKERLRMLMIKLPQLNWDNESEILM